MTELTKEQVVMFFSGDYDHLTCKEFRELTPKPKFSEGQILAWNDWPEAEPPDFQPSLMIYNHGTCAGYRPLNQTEAGPDWVPRAEFDKLLSNVLTNSARSYISDSHAEATINVVRGDAQRLLDSLPEDLK